MNARTLLALFDTIYLVALSAWVGGALWLMFFVGPILFKALGAEATTRFVRAVFPRYYVWGATAGAIALAACVSGPLSVPELRGYKLAVQAGLLLAGTLLMLYCGNGLTPKLIAARDAGPAGQERFEQLLRRGVWLNGIVLALGLLLLVGFATRAAPQTPGIVEPTPVERARLENEQFQKVIDKAHAPDSRPQGEEPEPGRRAAPRGP
jgi:uncharacterized membrane protein